MKKIIALVLLSVTSSAFANDNDNVFCTAEFMPSKCQVVYGSRVFAAHGTNKCVAYQNLVSLIRTFEWFMDPVADPTFHKNLECEFIPSEQ